MYTHMVNGFGNVESKGAGLNVAIAPDSTASGMLVSIETETNTQLLPNPITQMNEITHVNGFVPAPGGNRDDWSYDFQLMAGPTQGTLLLNVAMNAINGDFLANQNGLDSWNTLEEPYMIIVPEAPRELLAAAAFASVAGIAALRGRRSAPRSRQGRRSEIQRGTRSV